MVKEVDMKARMAAMRAAKAKKQGKPAAPAPKKVARVLSPLEKEIMEPIITKAEEIVKAHEEAPKQKKWKLKTMADVCALPDNQISYALFYMKTEFTRAIRTNKKIDHFTWTEGQRLETVLVGGNAFE